MDVKQITVAKFKKECLAILDRVGPEGLLITKHGKPIAKLFPVTPQSNGLIGAMKGKIKIKGNILSTGLKWSGEI